MNYEDSLLHKELPVFFKVRLFGSAFPAKFRRGDRLTIKNFNPTQFDEYILLAGHDGHEIVNFQKITPASNSNVIGVIVSFERSCNDGWEPHIGTSAERACLPQECNECSDFEFVEIGGKAWPYRMTSRGFMKCFPTAGKFHCSLKRQSIKAALEGLKTSYPGKGSLKKRTGKASIDIL